MNLNKWAPKWSVDNENETLDSVDVSDSGSFVENFVIVVDDRCCYENSNASVDSFCKNAKKEKRIKSINFVFQFIFVNLSANFI